MIRNKTVVTEEKFLKFHSDMFKQRTLPSVLLGVIGMVIGLVCIVLGILLENLLIPGIFVGAVFIILFGVILFLPNIAKNNAKKVFSENYKGKSQCESCISHQFISKLKTNCSQIQGEKEISFS